MMKKALIIALCCIVIGGLGFGITMALNHWNFGLLNTEKTETETFTINDDFHSILINSDTEDIEFRLSDDFICKVVCSEKENEKHVVSVENGTLVIGKTDTRKWYDYIEVFSLESQKITVFLPDNHYDSLTITESTGDIKIPNGLLFVNGKMTLSTGQVDCSASFEGKLCIETDTGDINLQDLSAKEIELSVTTGHIDAKSVVCSGDINVKVDTGKTCFDGVSCNSIYSKGDTGSIVLTKCIADNLISVERSTGDVTFEQSDAAELDIRTTTGNVSGSLLSDKVFIARSSTGQIDVPETITGGKCKISCDTGDIKIVIGNAI